MDKKVNDEVKNVTKGILVLNIIISLILFIFSFLDKQMATGILFGTIFAILNFRLLAINLQKALDMPIKKAQIYASSRYIIRMILTGMVILISVKAPYINILGVLIGLLSPKFVILGKSILVKKFKRKEA